VIKKEGGGRRGLGANTRKLLFKRVTAVSDERVMKGKGVKCTTKALKRGGRRGSLMKSREMSTGNCSFKRKNGEANGGDAAMGSAITVRPKKPAKRAGTAMALVRGIE